jgi:DivIVA domain-containing protein
VALDRDSIEKQDFPTARRGYDPGAVDAHLSVIAAEVEELRARIGSRGESVAGAASEQVRAILQAAEATASQIRADADEEAERIRVGARRGQERPLERGRTGG